MTAGVFPHVVNLCELFPFKPKTLWSWLRFVDGVSVCDVLVVSTNGAQTVGRKTSWAKDVWANYFLGDRRLGDKLGQYGDSKLDGWATLFTRLGEMCERGENQN